MALFSLLLILLAERLRLFSKRWVLEREFNRYRQWIFAGKAEHNLSQLVIALLLPAVVVATVHYLVIGQLFGVLHLALWLAVGLLLFGLAPLRQTFRHYLNAGRRGDLQACLLYAKSLDETRSFEANDGNELGLKMGQLSAWVNYRFYVAVSLYFLLLGPAAATLYVTVRAYHDHLLATRAESTEPTTAHPLEHPASSCESTQQAQALLNHALWSLDWLPSRVVAMAYALSGHFSQAAPVLVTQVFDWRAEPRQIIMQVAAKAEAIDDFDPNSISGSLQPMLALFKLAKRTFILLLVMAALLTLFGVIH